MLLAEANQWPEDAVGYFGQGDECHTAFHFPIMPRLFMGIQTEDRHPIVDILEQTPAIPASCQWVLFLRNHDELTLEMVTDEERDYMYRSYARERQARINLGIRRRLAPLLGNNRRKIELMKALLLSLPGTPVLYYGDEIGMGDNFYLGDRNGVRTPMQWSPDRNAGFSRGSPQRLFLPVVIEPEYHYETVNVEVQQNNPQSLLWWMKRTLSLRKQYQAFGRGTFELLYPENNKVLAFLRAHGEERILVVANLSRFAQHVELNLSSARGRHPVELFGRSAFPTIEEGPYRLSLGPHGFFWFSLEKAPPLTAQSAQTPQAAAPPPAAGLDLAWPGDWEDHFAEQLRARVEAVIPEMLASRTWFWGKSRTPLRAEMVEAIPITELSAVAFVRVDYVEGEPETYVLPLAATLGRAGEDLAARYPQAVLARLLGDDGRPAGVLHDALWDRSFAEGLLGVMGRRGTVRGVAGGLGGASDRHIRPTRLRQEDRTPGQVVVEQGDATVVFGSRFALRLVRRPEDVHPDLELATLLTERAFPNSIHVRGVLTYTPDAGAPTTVGILQDYVAHETDGWRLTLDDLGRYFERILTTRPALTLPPEGAADLAQRDIPPEVRETIGPFLQTIELLGRRTAELHLALSSDTADPRFTPEPFSALDQRSLVQSMRNLARQVLHRLRRSARRLPEDAQAMAQRAIGMESEVLARARSAFQTRFSSKRIRYHGNFHLGRVLYTGKDFVILFFEGEPARRLAERRIKRLPLRDVAAMMRSFHYVAAHALSGRVTSGAVRHEDLPILEPALRWWRAWISAAFLRSYLGTSAGAPFAPASPEELRLSLTAYLLEKTLYEIAYEVDQRPEWARIPLAELLEILERK